MQKVTHFFKSMSVPELPLSVGCFIAFGAGIIFTCKVLQPRVVPLKIKDGYGLFQLAAFNLRIDTRLPSGRYHVIKKRRTGTCLYEGLQVFYLKWAQKKFVAIRIKDILRFQRINRQMRPSSHLLLTPHAVAKVKCSGGASVAYE